jgi:hypothetical protein
LEIAAIIELDVNVGCFVLSIEGTGVAPSDCQSVIWAGYGTLTGAYLRICGPDGGCDANANISTLTVTT